MNRDWSEDNFVVVVELELVFGGDKGRVDWDDDGCDDEFNVDSFESWVEMVDLWESLGE